MFGKLRLDKTQKSPMTIFRAPQVPRAPKKPLNNPLTKKSALKKQKILSKTRQDLSGSEFRVLNEVLYTSDSQKAKEYFQQNPQHFQKYHQGFRKQCQGWDLNPVDRIIQLLTEKPQAKQLKLVDLGCGEAKIEESLASRFKKIRSYDLVSSNPRVIAADIRKLPLKAGSQDIAVFCLSLMGVNYLEFVIEALRVLKNDGELIIAEVESRSPDWEGFSQMIEYLGCRLMHKEVKKYFRIMSFKKVQRKNGKVELQGKYQEGMTLREYSEQMLKPCIYKKR